MTLQSATRLSLILIALALPSAPANADSSDIPQWYGTIRFSKTLHQHTDNPLEFQDQPGKKFSDVKVTWSGTIRFLPGRKSVVAATYTFNRLVDRHEDRMNSCPWRDGKTVYHDYHTIWEDTKVSVDRQDNNNNLAFILKPDGSYRTSVLVAGGKHVDKAQTTRIRREIYDECSKPILDIKDDSGHSSAGMESLTLNHVEGKAKPGATTLSGTWTGEDDDRGKFTYSWDLTLAAPELVARVQSTPSPVVRGASVTLDGKTSTGKIDKYEWKFTPDGDCKMAPEGAAVRLTGVSVTFKALCDFTAELKVSNSKDSDRASHPVTVEARKGDAWVTPKVKSVPGDKFSRPITVNLIHAGVNQCSLHKGPLDPSEATGHWLHTDAKDNKTWRTSGYVLAQVQDSGPFKGAWYVSSQSLKIERVERVNSELYKNGANYEINVAQKNGRDADSWGAQVLAHEAMHSLLVDEKLKMLKPDRDPAVMIEKLVGGAGEKAFEDDVNSKVAIVEGELQEVTSDENVAQRLRNEARFKRDVSIWMVGSNGKLVLKPMGPLSNIGQDAK